MILLDTHVWIWWVADPERLSAPARAALDEAAARERLLVSSISVWETAMLVERGRLELRVDLTDWISRSEALPYLKFVPVDNRIALEAVQLPRYRGKDPADRLIVATALLVGASLVTKDRRMRAYRRVTTIW
ncbi:MAG: type II toxin-antitoxin system VapC family toxin [Planctomycetota bacterium]|nr:type II toxin-antitoxin system VapC family toxin [Planctomycetota bacterium]